jgi:nucleotidyltransferase substrate binding protein (TIGR01987 family)
MSSISIAEYEKVLLSLEEAVDFAHKNIGNPLQFKIARDASIQRFEFSIELAWKISAKLLGSASTTAKPVIREMAQNGLLASPQQWFDFIEARNKSSHSYDEDIAKQVFSSAQVFLSEGKALLQKLKQR